LGEGYTVDCDYRSKIITRAKMTRPTTRLGLIILVFSIRWKFYFLTALLQNTGFSRRKE